MHVVIAPDSFKGSLDAKSVAARIQAVLKKKLPHAELTILPFSDGGEGGLDFLEQTFTGDTVWVNTQNALGEKIRAPYYRMGSKAWIELSQAAGLTQLSPEKQDPLTTSTFGVGILLKHALDSHISSLFLGIGGSATHDLGMGIYCALGGKVLDRNNQAFIPTGGTLNQIAVVDSSQLSPSLDRVQLQVVCDVPNPLTGPLGAAHVFAPQKGANSKTVALLEANSIQIGRLLESISGQPVLEFPGCGAAGGTAAGMKALLNGHLTSGFEIFYRWANMDEILKKADLLITGEGCLDRQSTRGKVPLTLAQKAQSFGTPTLIVCGQLKLDPKELKKYGVLHCRSLIEEAQTLQKAQEAASYWIDKATESLLKAYTNEQQ